MDLHNMMFAVFFTLRIRFMYKTMRKALQNMNANKQDFDCATSFNQHMNAISEMYCEAISLL